MEEKEPDANEDENGYSSGELRIVEEEKRGGKKTPNKKRKRSSHTNESSDEDIDVLPKTCVEVEEKLATTAAKNRLTAANVKNILKRVVSNEHVLALVKLREEELEEEEQIPSPKITRAKAKEMKKLKPHVSWPLPITPVKTPPIKVTSPEVTKLIAQDLPDEESDEEYQPNPDDASEDERDTISSMSDADSQPRTPATPGQPLDCMDVTPTKWTEDGLFKIPVPPSSEHKEEPTIALRTRSKLCLNDTPIEAIEQSFVPPDDIFDDDQIDNVWTDFLMEFSNPKTPTEPANEDDEEMDPEYNAEHEKVDEEEVWGDDEDIEVTRNEFNTLLTELYESMDAQFIAEFQDGIVEPMPPNINLIPTILQESHYAKTVTDSPVKLLDISKSQPLLQVIPNQKADDTNSSLTNSTKKVSCNISISTKNIKSEEEITQVINVEVNKQEVADSCEEYANITEEDLTLKKRVKNGRRDFGNGLTTINRTPPDWVFKEGDGQLSVEQREILDQQMRQHVQIATQNYLQIYGHPKLWSLGPQQKEFLTTLKLLAGDKPESAFRPCNLLPAIELCEKWEASLAEDTQENRDLIAFIEDQCEISRKYLERPAYLKKHRRYPMKFPDKFVDFVFESRGVFLYPDMLPEHPSRMDVSKRIVFLPAEDHLTAIALEEFIQYINANPTLYPANVDKSTQTKRKLMELITRYLVVGWPPEKLVRRIAEIRTGRLVVKTNATKHYLETGKAPKTVHKILPYHPNVKLIEHNPKCMPSAWYKLMKAKQPLLISESRLLSTPILNRGEEGSRSSEDNVENRDARSLRSSKLSEKPQNKLSPATQIVRPLQTRDLISENNERCISQSSNNKSDYPVFVKVVDQSGRECYHRLGPVFSPNTARCETVQSVTNPVVTTHESVPSGVIADNQNNNSSVLKDVANSTNHNRLPVKKRFKNLRHRQRNSTSESSSSEDEYRTRRWNARTERLVTGYPASEYTNNSGINNTTFATRHNSCCCKCITHNESNLLNEQLPEGQTLLTKYFKKLTKNNATQSPLSVDKNIATPQRNTPSRSIIFSTSRLAEDTSTPKDQSNCVDSTSVPDSNESLWKISNLHIYNRESYTLKTILSKLRCLLFVNWKNRAATHGTIRSKSKSRAIHAARVKLLREIYDIDTTMLPSMPYLCTPSKSSFDDEFNEREQQISATPKPTSVESTAATKESSDATNVQTSKKADDRPAQSKPSNARISLSSTSSKLNIKTTKAQKELEASRAMFATSDPFTDDLKDTTYATAFFEKVQERLTAKTDAELGGRDDFFEFQNILSTFDTEKETPCDLYFKLEKLFGSDNEDLTEEFLTFLTAGQAVQVGRFMDHFLLTNMTDFIERLQIYFARRPTQLRKILWSLNQIVDSMDSSNDSVSMEKIKTTILPHLKGNQYLVNWFMRLFPTDRPHDSLVSSGYEILDVEKLSKEISSEDGGQIDKLDYEIINIPNIEDSYGTDACCCECHNTSDEKYKNRSKHCMPCGMRYVQGRLYIPHGKGLRPGRVSWSNDEESRRQAVRLGLVQHRSMTVSTSTATVSAGSNNYTPTGGVVGSTSSTHVSSGSRRRAASHEPHIHAARESDDERVSPKRAVKCLRTPTSKTKFSKLQLVKNSKSGENEDSVKPSCSKNIIKDDRPSECLTSTKTNSNSDKFAEALPSEDAEDNLSQDKSVVSKTNVEGPIIECSEGEKTPSQTIHDDPWAHDSIEIHEQTLIKREMDSSDKDLEDMDDDATSQEDEAQVTERNIKMEEEEHIWTRDEDKAILLVLQCESDLDFTFEKIRRLLPHRSLEEIRERFQSVMQLLQQMASDR